MKKNLLSLICYLLPITCYLLPVTCSAAIPTDFYKSIDGKKGDAIRSALFDRIKGHTSISYKGLEPYYAQTDLDAQGHILDMYSLCTFDMSDANCSQHNVCDCWNKEHSVPQSWFGESSPMVSDLFHVVPTDARVNNFRGNMPYGETSSTAYIDGDKKALGHIGSSSFSGYTGKVFEPDDEYKGDFARIYFYMVTRYMDKNLAQSNGSVMFSYKSNTLTFTTYSINLLLKWHRQDPVSQKEIDRNNAVYGIQKNRNPFVDYPCLAEYIWGNHTGDQLDLTTIMSSEDPKIFEPGYKDGCNCKTDAPAILAPKSSVTLAVGAASVGQSVTQTLFIQGTNLTQSLSLSLSGTNAAYFSLEKNSLTAAEALEGYNLTITYTPTATSTSLHQATLTISSSELTYPRTVALTGECKATLVLPEANAEYHMDAEGIGASVEVRIPVRGTNLTLPVNVGLISGAPASFAVSAKSFSAAQVNAGDTLTVTYTPTAIGSESTRIYINQSNPSEFSQRFIYLYGSCLFRVLDPTDITHESATLHWTNAGKNSYQVDVFTIKTVEEPEHVILCDTAGAKANKVQYYDTQSKGYIRLGSGKIGGSISYHGLDLSKGAKITITAKAYNSSDNPTMHVAVNDSVYKFALTTSDADYSIDLEAGASSSDSVVIASPAKNQRFYVKYVTVLAGGTKEEREHHTGYPRSENYLEHTVSGLLPDTEYSYTITPDGLSESETATFTTLPFSPTNLDATPYTLHPTPFTKILLHGQIYLLRSDGHLFTLLGTEVE